MTEESEPRRRFLTVEQVSEELNVGVPQIRALLRSGELRGIQVGGRGVWRIGANDVEDFIVEAYLRTAERIATGDLTIDGEPDR
ncbi:helix-turn-helix domain-containing protein [Arthrobacter sp. NPDC056691]|uniref:helix-turn-helix domain-containing protein n=1 Tax=Arthrobacter sp. NPDC056691 TaxID=3345913 RepID=UPI00366B45C0